MEDLPEALLVEIIKRITKRDDLNSLSLVSKRLYTIEAEQKGAIRFGCSLPPSTEVLTSLFSRFPNLWKVEIDYSGWAPGHGNQLDNQGLSVILSCCPSLTDLTFSFCSNIDDSGLGCLAYCKKLVALRLDFVPAITSSGILSVAVGCKSLSVFHLMHCRKICSMEWLEHFGLYGSLEEIVIKHCKGISQYDLLEFGPGWMKLQKFEFEVEEGFAIYNKNGKGYDPLYNAHSTPGYDFSCESLKDLRLAHITVDLEIGLRVLLGKCKALEKLCLEYVYGLNDNDMIALSKSCRNLRSISLWLTPHFYKYDFMTSFSDESFKALAVCCPMLQAVELTFDGCEPTYPSEIGFTQGGLIMLIQSCPIRALVLRGANFFNDEGMKALWSASLLETLELVDCRAITDAGMCFISCAPCLSSLTLRLCEDVTDDGVAELVRAHKLESLIIEGCRQVSLQAVQGVARSVHYSVDCASPGDLKRAFLKCYGCSASERFQLETTCSYCQGFAYCASPEMMDHGYEHH